jgi:hypothetical protein
MRLRLNDGLYINMNAFLPIYTRPPNKLLRYELRNFDDKAGNTGKLRLAIYNDKHGKQQEAVAQVLWD